jgi:hypothetical protein
MADPPGGRFERFRREARAAARLHHTNIDQVHGTGGQDGMPYFVMQYIPGAGLDRVIYTIRERQGPAAAAPPEGNGGRPPPPPGTSWLAELSQMNAPWGFGSDFRS